MLSDDQLASMSATQEEAFPDLANVDRPTKTTSAIGAAVSGANLQITTDLPCRVTPAQMLEVLGQQARPMEVNRYIIRVPVGSDVLDRDEFVVTTQDNIRLRVERVKDVRSYATVLTLEAEVVT